MTFHQVVKSNLEAVFELNEVYRRCIWLNRVKIDIIDHFDQASMF